MLTRKEKWPLQKPTRRGVILFKKSNGASERLTFRHQPAHPKKKKKMQTLIKKTKPLIQKKKKKRKKKKRQTLKPKPYILIKIQTHSNLRFFAANPYTHKSN